MNSKCLSPKPVLPQEGGESYQWLQGGPVSNTTCCNTRRNYGDHQRGDVSPANFRPSEECEGHPGGKILPEQDFLLATYPHPGCPRLLALCPHPSKLATRGKASSFRGSDPSAHDKPRGKRYRDHESDVG